MKLHHLLQQLANRLPPQTWLEAYAVIVILDLTYLLIAFLFDHFQGALP